MLNCPNRILLKPGGGLSHPESGGEELDQSRQRVQPRRIPGWIRLGQMWKAKVETLWRRCSWGPVSGLAKEGELVSDRSVLSPPPAALALPLGSTRPFSVLPGPVALSVSP